MSFWKKLFGASSGVRFVRTQCQANGHQYDIHRASSRAEAIAFLRQAEVKEEGRYLIVETPEGNVGKDFILIFDEQSGRTIEISSRKRLAQPKKSTTNCSFCGYAVIPFKKSSGFDMPGIGSVEQFVIVSDMKKQGTGFQCPSCRSVICAMCATPESGPQCGFCGSKLSPFKQS